MRVFSPIKRDSASPPGLVLNRERYVFDPFPLNSVPIRDFRCDSSVALCGKS
jgi:hypothetical protein